MTLFYFQEDPLGEVPGPKTNIVLNLNKLSTISRFFKVLLYMTNEDPKLCLWDRKATKTENIVSGKKEAALQRVCIS